MTTAATTTLIRPARPQDCAAILRFWNPLIRDTLVTFNAQEKTEAELQATLQDKAAAGYGFFVGVDVASQEVLGFAYYGQFRAGVGYTRSMEHTIILSDAARGRGLGRGLMTAVEDHARARGAHVMMAGVSGGNPAGRAFHAALGYAEVGILPATGWKFGQYWDLVLMQKLLD